ncbi:MAG: MBL fold metallo-hydrolase [Deltaproteobacteria bacterium]|nr:MBL fold metallo-hydrolase [Deltaproteobacteria bacterium]
MEVTILGSGTAIPIIDRASPSCALFVKGEPPMLFDVGPGTLRQLTRLGISHEAIGRIFLTHFHPDHCADLIHLFFATRNPRVLERRKPFVLMGPSGLNDFMASLHRAFDASLELPQATLELKELPPDGVTDIDFGNFRIRTAPTGHTPNSLAFRVDSSDGSSVVFSGDTGFSEAVIDLAQGADLLILESAFPDGDEVTGHLTPSLAGRMAALAGVRRLVLTHFYPESLSTDIPAQCRKNYDGELILARDLLRLCV